MKTRIGKRGFTLVEIMIVVAIIGLLAAIAIPNLLRARINSNDSAIQGDSRAFSTASESYRAAQQPATYGTIALMVTPPAGPGYLDATWNNANLVKHGHNLVYTAGAAVNGVISSYTLAATARANEAQNGYCIDQTGVLRVDLNAAPQVTAGTSCNGTAVQS